MKKEAILHIPLSQYAYATGTHALTVRIRTAKNDLQQCLLYYGDRVDQNPQIRTKKIIMEHSASDDLFDYYECSIEDHYTRICYYFWLEGNSEDALFYDERGLHDGRPENRTEFFQFPYIRREDMLQIPQWANQMVMYHIFPDSFASGYRTISGLEKQVMMKDSISSVSHLGGTLQGVMENVDYLQALGVNCIYLNPIFAANSYHKYDTVDYFSIDPCFGTMEDFRQLVKVCHAKGIRVILDGVFNHCGASFFAFRDVLEHGHESKYYHWFYEMPEPVLYENPPSYEAFAYVREMPKLNTGNPEVEEYLIRVGTYWIQEADIDGWRLDVANEINHDFWRHFHKAVRAIKPDIFLIGEIWEDAGVWLLGDQFDSTMNYRFSYLCKDFFASKKLTVSEFDAQIHKMIQRYPREVSLAQMNFLDSHDIPRFLSACSCKEEMELAFFYLFMGYGIPSVFYGDECYLSGKSESEYRKAMSWKEKNNCYDKFREWIAIRKEHSAIQNGAYVTLFCDDAREVYIFARKNEVEIVLVCVNRGAQEYEVSNQQWKTIEQTLHGRVIGAEGSIGAQKGRIYLVVTKK